MKTGPKMFSERRRKSKLDEARDILAHVVLCHVPAVRYNFAQKVGGWVLGGRGEGGGGGEGGRGGGHVAAVEWALPHMSGLYLTWSVYLPRGTSHVLWLLGGHVSCRCFRYLC